MRIKLKKTKGSKLTSLCFILFSSNFCETRSKRSVEAYRGKNLHPSIGSLTGRDRHHLERAITCLLLQSTIRDSHKFIGKLENSSMISV
jgi:hypothetical protein